MITIGDVCPIFFHTLKYKYANESSFRQVFDKSDGILLQLFCDNGETPTAYLNDKVNGSREEVDFLTYDVNEKTIMYYTYIYPSEGVYTITVEKDESEEFEVCESSGWCLVEYTHKDNNSAFDDIFWADATQLTFKMRIPGGFKPSGVSMEVVNEQFVNQRQELIELYSIPYVVKTLSIGDVNGVPYWIAEHLNKVLCLSDVKINGEGYIREGNSKPEKVETLGKKETFLWSVNLRPAVNPVAGIGGKKEKGTSVSVVGFSIKSPTDGEVLVYDANEGAFVNSETLSSN